MRGIRYFFSSVLGIKLPGGKPGSTCGYNLNNRGVYWLLRFAFAREAASLHIRKLTELSVPLTRSG